jgi:phosphohistidine phosphatase SixA
MKKTLVIMRHGKAMPLAQGQSDAERSLTKAGGAALSARLPHMLSLVEAEGGAARIWTSPATRARQTAKLLKKALRENHVSTDKIEPHDCLWKQDVDGLLDDLRNSDAELVFAVGHAPFVENVVERLVGSSPSFSTGALGCLEVRLADADEGLDSSARDDARLLWFAQGPASADWNTLVQLQATMTAVANKIEDRRAAFFDHPEDIETIHRFRTNSRTLRSLVAFVKPWQSAEQNAETQVILRDIVRHTSRLRELDVLEKQVRTDPDASPKFRAYCTKAASAERAKVLGILSSKKVTRLFERAMSLSKSVAWKKRYALRGLPQDEVRARFDAMVESVSADLAALDLHDAERTHDVRKRAKRVRYTAEQFAAVLGPDASTVAEGMNAHQDDLGEVCDARANIRLIDEFLLRDLPKSIVRDLNRMRAQNVEFLRNALKSGETKA